MAWKELLASLEKSMADELGGMLKSAEDKKRKMLEAAEESAGKLLEESRAESGRDAELLHDEIVSGGRIRSGNLRRQSRLREIDAVYAAFREKLMDSPELKKKLLINFLEKEAAGAAEAELSGEAYALLKGSSIAKKIKLVKKNSDCPVVVNMDKAVLSFSWDEFLEQFKASTIRKVSGEFSS